LLFWIRWIIGLLQAFEMFIGEVEEGGEFEVGGAPFGEMGLVVDGDGDAGHAGGFGGDDAVEGVFEGETLQGAHFEGCGTVHVDLGVGFAIGEMFGGGYGFEFAGDVQFFYNDIDQGKWG
jgi:hypothetical protein